MNSYITLLIQIQDYRALFNTLFNLYLYLFSHTKSFGSNFINILHEIVLEY